MMIKWIEESKRNYTSFSIQYVLLINIPIYNLSLPNSEICVKENTYTYTFNAIRFFAYLFFSLLRYTSYRLAVSKG
jgi:hypothetical protein